MVFVTGSTALNAASISQTKADHEAEEADGEGGREVKRRQMRKAAAEAESRMQQRLAQLLCGFLAIHIYQTRTL